MFNSAMVKAITSAAALVLALGLASFSAQAALERVGPINTAPSVGSFPAWYQDTTGLALEFCDPQNQAEVDGGWCLLLPGDVTVPEVFPTNFFDEHFWFAADALMTTASGSRALLVLAVEAAFAAAVEPGGQVAFSRIRVRLDDVPVSGTYRFIHPYGEEIVEGVAGERIFFTDDFGIACAQGDFSCAMDSRLGPFLLPSNAPGGAELPPVAGPVPGKLYIADPARSGPVTGSALPNFIDSTGASRTHNIFRIEGPPGSGLGVNPATGAAVDYIETTNFTLMGRIFTGTIPGRIDISRASYSRKAAGQKLHVFATGSGTTQGRLPAQPRSAPVLPSLSFFDAPCTSAVDANGFPVPPFSAPATGIETNMSFADGRYWGRTVPAAIPSAVCVKDGNARDANGNVVPTFIPHIVADEVTVTQAFYDENAQTLTVMARSSDETAPPVLTLRYGSYQGDLASGQIVVPNVIVPPDRARVISSKYGVTDYQVSMDVPAPANTAPVAVADTGVTTQGVPVTIAVLANDSDADANPLSVTAVSAVSPATAGSVTNNGSDVTFNSNSLFTGVATFTYTVSDGQGGTATASVSVTVNAVPNQAPVANADSASTAFGTPVTVNVLANDTDANGDPLSVIAVTNGTKGTVVNNGTSVTYTPSSGTSGTDLFTYTVADGRGGSATGTVTVTVAAASTITVSLADFIVNNSEWRIAGTDSTIGATVTVRRGVDLTGPVIGTAVVSSARTWVVRVVNSAILPDASNTISMSSTDGAQRLAVPIRLR
ncbi:MAG: tandem-95 repeat protein [Betaproteobacteria bacterium]|nr:tandem-95 repeat protein [Betaproteobacteria bacterium]